MASTGPGRFVTVATGDILLYQMVCQQSEQVAYTGIHYRVGTVNLPAPTLGELVQGLDQVFASLIKNLVSSEAQYKGSILRRVWPKPPSPMAGVIDAAGPGLVVGTLMARQVSGVISKVTALAGRAYRGRCYTPFPAIASNVSNGVPTPVFLTALNALATELAEVQTIIAVAPVDLHPVIYHKGPKPPEGTYHDLIGTKGRQFWATQRRRGSFGRPNSSPI